MTAELLRRAAKEMRERAEAATASPWRPENHDFAEDGCGILGGGTPWSSAEYGIAFTTGFTNRKHCHADAEHIASWHPAVALAVADWLDYTAALIGVAGGRSSPYHEHAIAVARAYLGEAS